MARIAVIDTGTNSSRLLIAEGTGEGIREVVRQTTITRLGEGVDSRGRLSREATGRVSACVAGYAATIGELGTARSLVIATSSVRDAENGERFIAGLAASFGFEHRLLSGEEEAWLAFSGATMDVDEGVKVLLFDVGGGSTEIVAGRAEEVEFSSSMKMGCVRVRERFLRQDPASASEISAAAEYIDHQLKEEVDHTHLRDLEMVLAVAGTVTTLAAIDLGLETYQRELVHGHRLSRARVDELLSLLSGMTVAERLRIPVIEEGRADVITAGALIVSRLLAYLGIPEFTVSEHDILEGAALALAGNRL
ncbi:MAG: Ppx/GppA family phosphatase [Thermoleophilia bacterium]|nr:Ppx/GppA family phosphatase [Thermoleophilia bacterium]